MQDAQTAARAGKTADRARFGLDGERRLEAIYPGKKMGPSVRLAQSRRSSGNTLKHLVEGKSPVRCNVRKKRLAPLGAALLDGVWNWQMQGE